MESQYLVAFLLVEYIVGMNARFDYPFSFISIIRSSKRKGMYDIHVSFYGLHAYYHSTYIETDQALALLGDDLLGQIVIESKWKGDEILRSLSLGQVILKDVEYELLPETIDEFCEGISPEYIEVY